MRKNWLQSTSNGKNDYFASFYLAFTVLVNARRSVTETKERYAPKNECRTNNLKIKIEKWFLCGLDFGVFKRFKWDKLNGQMWFVSCAHVLLFWNFFLVVCVWSSFCEFVKSTVARDEKNRNKDWFCATNFYYCCVFSF